MQTGRQTTTILFVLLETKQHAINLSGGLLPVHYFLVAGFAAFAEVSVLRRMHSHSIIGTSFLKRRFPLPSSRMVSAPMNLPSYR